MSRDAGVGAGESGLIQMSLSLGASDDVVDGSSSFKSPNTVEREILGSNPSLSRSSTTRIKMVLGYSVIDFTICILCCQPCLLCWMLLLSLQQSEPKQVLIAT
ncbi:uncharacterized protein LOC126706255 isoform X2 [Quercus robur]|uniref:uncharacterized protein LOC126706255 isoform X2 n=1 Tax=Quercus robur TaxID=38942 RepID=UPI0021638E7A|nr:uncharacterized protein LOC126706255 isoform X2 [Quercus robur]